MSNEIKKYDIVFNLIDGKSVKKEFEGSASLEKYQILESAIEPVRDELFYHLVDFYGDYILIAKNNITSISISDHRETYSF
ncbi:hypothetical protein BW721_04815 [Jeotgalibaca sp. PTS2502]|uniref:hypothetical protein n=1 Tax=Jeotgalibaca sp. PTS2502 TaxID=1903686 RepID=UPI000973D98D|nr:hypothetical protein [Jeotgalibaca sp. PTS2502]APZ49058.1 hypothetical protein BW721_04815 [Jeotgalibaca sp. PTS2502]